MTASGAIRGLLTAQILFLLGCASPASDVRIIDPWASEPAGAKATTIAGFMCIQNDGPSPIRIVSASSEMVERVEIHEIVHEQGIVRMKKVEAVDIPSNSTVCLEPKHTHLMLIGIDDAIRGGAEIRLQIDTASGEKLQVVLPQRALSNAD